MNAPVKARVVDMGDDPRALAHVEVGGMMSAEIDRQIATAKNYPRSIERFRKTVLALATLNEDVAAQCLYAMPRGNKTIEGPSIRFAEIVLAAWGNCRVASQVIGEDGSFVKAHGLFWDLETNAAIGFEMRRRITNRNGQRFDDDMIAVTGNAASSIARRNATLGGVPKALWLDLYEQAKAVAVGTVQTLASRRAKAIDAFKKFGITEAQIFATLGIAGINEIDLDGLAKLRGFLTAITSEEKDPEEIFAIAETKASRAAPPPPAEPNGDAGKAPVADTGQATLGGSKAAPASPASTKPPALEGMVTALIADAESADDLEAIEPLLKDEFEAASTQLRSDLRGRIAAAIEAHEPSDDFPGDRPSGDRPARDE